MYITYDGEVTGLNTRPRVRNKDWCLIGRLEQLAPHTQVLKVLGVTIS
jgi:hypothetical protein